MEAEICPSASPHEEAEAEAKVTYAEEEGAFLYLAPVHGPHDDGSYQTYLVHVQEAEVEIDLCPLSYAETSRLIENLLFLFLLSLLE